MRKLAVFCLLIFIFLPTRVWSQPHEVASQLAVSLAMRNPWPNLPTPAQITDAYNEYKSKLGKNVTITSGPSRMSAPWEKDPLYANKVVLTIRADYSSQTSQVMAVVLKYDFMSAKFKFEGVILQGVKRYKGDKSTMSYLEPQDLVYLKQGWIASGAPSAAPPPAPTPPTPGKKWTVNDAVALAVEEYIRQFEGKATCFGQVVKLGNLAKYRAALDEVNITTDPGNVNKDAKASLVTFTPGWSSVPPNELRIPFDVPLGISIGAIGGPQKGALTPSQKQTLYHETTHEIESLHSDLRDKSDPTAERNADYLDGLVNALNMWKISEQQVIRGERTPEEAKVPYENLENAFSNLQKKFNPDLAKLEAWAGIRIRIEDIRKLYLSEACDKALRKVVENYMLIEPDTGSEPSLEDNGITEYKPVDTVKPPNPSHIVYAMIYDNKNGQPIEGAAFTVLRPGVTTQEWISSEFNMELVAAMGVSDKSGMVVLSQSLEKGKTYSLMVARESYNVVRHETLSITEASPEPLKITVKLKR
ncbi:MAG: hypothetical protein HZA70_03035 [Planctomycetes bacterium]|nr:hypothetical protein [Planctomycetota bacterium]